MTAKSDICTNVTQLIELVQNTHTFGKERAVHVRGTVKCNVGYEPSS